MLIAHIESSRSDLLKLDQTKINPDGVAYANLEQLIPLSQVRLNIVS